MNNDDVPSYLPPWPTEWPDTPAEANRVIAGMQPRTSKRAIAGVLASIAAPVAIVAYFAPQAIAFLAPLAAIAIGAAGARRKNPRNR